jgi:hypothetical protein
VLRKIARAAIPARRIVILHAIRQGVVTVSLKTALKRFTVKKFGVAVGPRQLAEFGHEGKKPYIQCN